MASYPSINLQDAIQRIRQVYEKEGVFAADRDTMAQAMGYSGRNGASDAVLAALSHYGLLQDVGKGQLKISRIGLDIVLHERGEPDRATAIVEAARQPALFEELRAQFGDRGFSDRNMIAYLVKNEEVKEAVAQKIVKLYRDTISIVNDETQGLRTENPPISREQIMPNETIAPTSTPRTVELPPSTSNKRTLHIPIDYDTAVDLTFDGDYTDETIEGLIEHLQLMQRRLGKRKQNNPPTEQDDS